ncbi:MAG: pterin dehydratase [Actinobacteria bacterium]|nr:MAG: pterin dehydratase [Actinomycetota bacterium]
MRGLWGRRGGTDSISDALTVLTEWTRDGRQLRRTLALSEAQHAALTERVKVVADALRLRPEIRRLNGHTQIALGSRDGDPITESDITLAARIEDAYRAVINDE